MIDFCLNRSIIKIKIVILLPSTRLVILIVARITRTETEQTNIAIAKLLMISTTHNKSIINNNTTTRVPTPKPTGTNRKIQ